ncbi:MAG TPA: hypothetical protein VJ484_12305, partial [Lysobacter sp.]|nr:hypothetical protein [Lysobacter sp.]
MTDQYLYARHHFRLGPILPIIPLSFSSFDGSRYRLSRPKSAPRAGEQPEMIGVVATTGACSLAFLNTAGFVAPPPDALVPYPNPLITEVHYNVRGDGDAARDGQRDAVGDEFIELINPHDKPIRLRGFTLIDSDASSRKSNPSGARDKDDHQQPRGKGDNAGKDKPARKADDDNDAPKAGETRQV